MVKSKKIIVCCDGTWNKPGNKDGDTIVKTNVQKMYEAISPGTDDIPQVKYYGQGVGTGFSIIDHFLGGSAGVGIDRNILDAYKFIMWNYDAGDEIYLFGFSRGAYTVRSLAGFIRNCGIMQPIYLNLVDEAYHLYRDRTALTHPESDLMKGFRRKYGIDTQETFINFLGVWDTVGALGIPLKWLNSLNQKYEFHDVKISSQIKYAYHALSVDEKRQVFKPTLWEINPTSTKLPEPQVSEQVWFPGVHSNIGGGYKDSGLSDIALKWMMEKAGDTELQFDEEYEKSIEAKSTAELRNSVLGFYKFMKKINREINTGIGVLNDPYTGEKISLPVERNEHIHYTCFERKYKDADYRPVNITQQIIDKTSFDPLKDKWEEGWLKYIN